MKRTTLALALALPPLVATAFTAAIMPVFSAPWSGTEIAPATKIAQADPAKAAFEKTFLSVSDLPAGFKMTQSESGKRDESPHFAKFNGEWSGMRVFQAPMDASLQRIVDIRYAFPNEQAAQSFIDAARGELSENAQPVPDVKPVGSSCKVYGGVNKMAQALGLGTTYHFYYTFREGRVVVKIYGSEGPDTKKNLSIGMVAPIAEAADKHCKGY